MTVTPTDIFPECGHPASELLDFHVNGSLEGEEAARVAAHVSECAACSRDVRELMTLSASIAEHGAIPGSPWRGNLLWGWLGTAAAMLLIGTIVYRLVPSESIEPRIAASLPATGAATGDSAVAAGGVQTLDLGVGTLRDGATSPPRADLGPGTSTLRLTLRPPVVPDQKLLIGVTGPGNADIVAAAPLPPLDPEGRATVEVPASRLTTSGNYLVVIRTAAAQDDVVRFTYPFAITVPAK